jgi:hypothetical protein
MPSADSTLEALNNANNRANWLGPRSCKRHLLPWSISQFSANFLSNATQAFSHPFLETYFCTSYFGMERNTVHTTTKSLSHSHHHHNIPTPVAVDARYFTKFPITSLLVCHENDPASQLSQLPPLADRACRDPVTWTLRFATTENLRRCRIRNRVMPAAAGKRSPLTICFEEETTTPLEGEDAPHGRSKRHPNSAKYLLFMSKTRFGGLGESNSLGSSE